MQTFPLRPFLPFLPASFPPRVTLGRHPLPLSRPSIYLPASHPAILPSGHRAIHLAFFPSLSLLAAPAFFPGLVPGSVLLGLPSRGRAPTPVFPTSPALLHDRPSRGPSRDSSRRLFPETLSEELCWSIVPKPPCLPQSFSPPATRLLSSDIGNPCTRFFPMDVFIEVFRDVLTRLFRNACSGSCAGTPVLPALHPVALWHCA